MPKVTGPFPPPDSGNHQNGKLTGLASKLKPKTCGTDDITIGVEGRPIVEQMEGSTMADVANILEGVRYLVKGWIPFGMLTGIVAEPGVGKSAFALWLARSVMTGEPWFDGSLGPQPAHVLWCPTENDMAITRQRVIDWKIPMDKLLLPFKDDPLRSVNLALVEHTDRIEALVCKYKTPLVVLDSLRGGHGEDENNSRVSSVISRLAVIAERTKAAIIVIHHTKKMMVDQEVVANSSRGSNAIMALMRSMLGVDKPNPKSDWNRIRVVKENLGLAPPPVGYRITNDGLQFGMVPKRPDRTEESTKAEVWLRSWMVAGVEYPSVDLIHESEQRGFSQKTIRRVATERLGVIPRQVRKDGKIGHWVWELPAAG